MSSDRLNSRLRRMSYKLQHWMVTVEYLPGPENTMADALSREARPRRMTSKDLQHLDVSLASVDVEAGAPHRRQDSERAATLS